MKSQPGSTQIIQLSGLRGIAILLVLFVHLFGHGLLSNILYFGWSGVDLFFVLSGFLITGILIDTKQHKNYFKFFWIKRVLRIFPLYYGVLLVFAFISPHFPVTAWFGKYQLYFWTYTSNYLILTKGFFHPLGHFWSLAAEEQFYVFWPFVVRFISPRQLLAIAVLFIFTGILIRHFSTNVVITFGLPLARLDGLMIGSIVAVLIRQNKALLFRYINLLFAALLFIMVAYTAGYLLIYGIREQSLFVRLPFTFTLIALFFGCVLVMSLKHVWLKEILSNRLLLFFGKYSYGMYIFNSIFFHFSNWGGADRLPVEQRLVIYLGVFMLTVIVSYLSYNLFEIRFLRLKRHLYVS
ncbi:MAG TPA: acyltransferase [Chitinophagaceae bacterium]|nr:acyltransferase [Chitinophagaceae bacterium]